MINDYNGGWQVPTWTLPTANRALQATMAWSDSVNLNSNFDFGVDTVTLGSSSRNSNSLFDQVRQLKELQRRQAVAAQLGNQLPSNWETMPLDQFLSEAAAIRSAAGPSKGGKPGDKKDASGGEGLQVKAHNYTDSEGKTIPVKRVTISEAGNYRNREQAYNPTGSDHFEAGKSDIKEGGYATVYVEYEDGVVIQKQVQNKGWIEDIYRN